tara:strand:+ start:7389 stop:8102 length:714 start_codon:yes stop_codon:yes gene_type:complete
MFGAKNLTVERVTDDAGRLASIDVLRETYEKEKEWVADGGKVFESEDLEREDVSWFLVKKSDRPIGVLRVMYDPPLELYHEYGFKPVDGDLDVEKFVRENKIAEIGRFAVIPDERKNFVAAAILMRAAVRDTVEKGYSHYITDVFEGEKHSPYKFHTRVMGFKAVATHDVGELNCPCRRITMVLDLKDGYNRLRKANKWIYRYITDGWPESLHEQMLEAGSKGEDWSPDSIATPSLA